MNTTVSDLSFERILQLLAQGERDAGADLFSRMGHAHLCHSAERRVQKLLTGERSVARLDDMYFVGPVTDQQRELCRRARSLLAAHGISIGKLMLIEFAGVPSQLAATLPIDAQTVYLCLAGVDERELAAAVAHEFSHVALSSGNRFLDEGAAYYFELTSQGRFPETATHKATQRGAQPALDLRTLLAYDARDDVYFEQLVPDNDLRIHAIGALLFDSLIRRIGVNAVTQVYSRIGADGAEADAAAAIEHAAGVTLEELVSPVVVAPPTQAAMCATDIDVAEEAYIAADTETLIRYYTAIIRHGRAQASGDVRLAEAELLVLAAGAVERGFERKLGRFEGAFVRGQLLHFLSTQPRSSRYYLFRALMSIARASCEGSILDANLLLDEARADLEIALAGDGYDPLVLSCLARVEWNSPQGGTAGKLRALSLLKRIAALGPYTELVAPSLAYCMAHAEGGKT